MLFNEITKKKKKKKNHISHYFPFLLKFEVFPRMVINSKYQWEFLPLVFTDQPWFQGVLIPSEKGMVLANSGIAQRDAKRG